MSNSLQTIYRLHAWKDGKPIPHGERINVHIADDDDLMIVAFIRMGGESRPWGVAFGNKGSKPTILAVPDGRNRTLVADIMAEFGKNLLGFFRHPGYSDDTTTNYKSDPARQVWLPGPTHIEMLHFLALAYARTRFQRDDVELLRSLGNLANCLYIEQQRPGQQTVISATAALREAFHFPSASIRQAHLGHLLGWLNGGATRDERLGSATEAEGLSVATSLNPEVERKTLDSEVERWNNARAKEDSKAQTASESAIRRVLTRELMRRWMLTNQTIEQIRNDRRKRNEYLQQLVDDGAESFYFLWGRLAAQEYDSGAQPWPNVYTDRYPRTASDRYLRRNANLDDARSRLVHGDRELQREELAAGHAMTAIVMKVHAASKRWTLKFRYPEQPSIEIGKRLVIAGLPKNWVTVQSIDYESQVIEVEPGWVHKKPYPNFVAPPAYDKGWQGKDLVLLKSSASHLNIKAAERAREKITEWTDIVDLIQPRPRFQAANDDEGPISELVEQE